uniref:Uncharacterized protein n=1 Tax=Tanacetum cinerariifolium TaxID=118510 RepID=A0A6L2NCF7_TANCI|nr:hypothetical protein [Tanacetum cinerariifolium]
MDNSIENLTNTLALLTQSYKTYLPQTNNQLRTSSNPKNQATIQDGRVVVQNVQGRQNRGQGNNARGAGAAGYGGAQNIVGYANPGGQDNAVDEDVDEQPLQDLALNVDNLFQADDCDAFDSDVDEAPTAQTMFMANLSSADVVYDEASPSNDSDILSVVHDHDHYKDAVCEHHEVHEMHDDVQPNYVVDSHTDYTSDSNMIPYDQYVKDNAVPVVQSNVSSNNNVVDKSLTAELATYKEQVELYERRARFELAEREQKIDEQLRIVITDRNIKEEKLKKKLHCVKMQLASTINHNKSMNKVAIGYKNPLCLTCAKQVQPALYNGHEIIKTDHVPAIMHNSEDTLEIAEITRKKMNEKMKTPLWTHNKINIRPPDYSKENFLATFTPQTQLTPEQMFWSKDVLKMKTEALAEQAKAAKPVRALTVYPPNTPVKLVPRTCKKRITPTGLTEGERGFEQTKECYLTKRIESDEIERKNLLNANDTLIANCLSKEVFYIATNSELNVSRFSGMHDAHTVVQARCLKLEIEFSKLKDKIQKDDHDVMVKRFSNLEVQHLNLQLKYHLKENLGNNNSLPAQDGHDFDSVFEIKKLKASIQGKDNAIRKLRTQISQLQETRSEADRTLDFRALDFQITQEVPPRLRNNSEVNLDYLKHLKESVETLREIVEEAKAERQLDRNLRNS